MIAAGPRERSIRYAGQEVAAVAAETEEIARDALSKIRVEYDVHPFVTDLDNGRRYATIEDFRNVVKLAYMLPHMHMSENSLLIVFSHTFTFYVVHQPFGVECGCHALQAVTENVQVDVRAATDMPRHNAADQSRPVSS